MTEEKHMDVSIVCRICLVEKGNVNVFEHCEEQDRFLPGYSVADKIMSFACIEVSAYRTHHSF